MKKIYITEEAPYYREGVYYKEEKKTNDIKIEKLDEHLEKDFIVLDPGELPKNIKFIINKSKFLNEDCGKMNIEINKEEFKSLFGPNVKPRKGDYLSLKKAQKKFKVKKVKKYIAKKAGKGYKLTLKKMK